MKKGIVAVMVFWLSIVGISFRWNLEDEKREYERLAYETARAFFQQILITRAWNAGHGGVYVPVSNELYPNTYLEDPQRDIVTDKGIRLTKINPAYMTRQIADIASRRNGIKFHITSLNPLRPQNKPTSWETEWLQAFEQGAAERGDFFVEGPDPSFRYMAPLIVEESCLQCHAKQGYKKGDVRGGISVTIPYFAREENTGLVIGYSVTAVAGVIFTLIGGIMLQRKRSQLIRTNESLEKGIAEKEELINKLREANSRIKILGGVVPICMYCKEIRDDQGYWNQLEKFITEHSDAQFSHGICPKCMKEHHPDVDLEEGADKSE